jgi:hypothetical protein
VGQLIKIAAERGNKTRPGIKLGICGEHGGDPESVKFCHRAGLTYVSCSPFRVPVARLAAAQAALWNVLRVVAEPGGAAALASVLSGRYAVSRGERVGVLVCGANTTAVSFA